MAFQGDFISFLHTHHPIDQDSVTLLLPGIQKIGDSAGYSDTFFDALGMLHDDLADTGCRFFGSGAPSDYTFDSSAAVRDGRFVGLPIDENNEGNLTAGRINKWTVQLKNELS